MRSLLLPKVGAVLLVVSSVLAQNERKEKPVKPEELYVKIDEADEVEVQESYPMEGMREPKVIYRSKKPEDIKALKNALQVDKPESRYVCSCYGSESVVLKRAGQKLAVVVNHHGDSVGTSLWGSLAPVSNPDAWVQWFADRGISGPKDELVASRVEAEQSRKDRESWLAAMPPLIRPVWNWDSYYHPPSPDIEPLAQAMAKQSATESILELLTWSGSGVGDWNGGPAYEMAAESLLMRYPTSVLVEVIQKEDLTQSQMEAAAKLLSGWNFHSTRPEDAKKLPESLRKKLWEFCKGMKDEDKLRRAKQAFSGDPER